MWWNLKMSVLYAVSFGVLAICFAESGNLPDPEKSPGYYADKWLVITKTETSKEKCECGDGVVLKTDDYENLKDGLFICCQYAVHERGDANKFLKNIKLKVKDAYTKYSGSQKKSAMITGLTSEDVRLIEEIKYGSQTENDDFSYIFQKQHLPILKISVSFSDEKIVVDGDVPPEISDDDPEFNNEVEERKIINAINLSFLNNASQTIDSTCFKFTNFTSPIVYLPLIKIYNFGRKEVLITSEFSNKYDQYMTYTIVGKEGVIKYSQIVKDCQLQGVTIEQKLPAIKLYCSGEYLNKVWNGTELK